LELNFKIMKKTLGWLIILLPFITIAVVCAVFAKLWVFFAALGITIAVIALLFLGVFLIEN